MIRYLLLAAALLLACSQTTDIKPTCNTPYTLSYIPISIQETEVFDMDDYISGFNLQLEMQDQPSFVHLSDKFAKKAGRALPQPGLRGFHIDHVDNTWGNTFISISERNFTTTVRWGKMSATESIPDIIGEVDVPSTNLECYDAVLFPDQSLAMLDCATRVGSEELGFGYTNKFVYIDTAQKKVLPDMVDNELYVPYTSIRHRRFFRYTEDGYHYLMRIYFADGVDGGSRDNTYFELMSANNPKQPFVLKVVDRSFLDLDRLAIMDFKLYLGDMYLLDLHQGIIRLDITGAQKVLITGRYRTDSNFQKFGVYSSDLDSEFLLVLCNRHAVYEIDWTNQIFPKLVTKYSLMANSTVTSLQVNHRYVVVQSESNSSEGHLYNMTWIFTRGSRVYSNAYAVLPHSSRNTYVDLNRQWSFILSLDEDNVQLWELNPPRLMITPSDPTLIGSTSIFSIVGRSFNPVTGRDFRCTFTYKLAVVKADNYSLWPTGLTPSKEYYANYPGELFIPLNRYVLGPNITWGVNETAFIGELPPWWINQQNKSFVEWGELPPMNKLNLLRMEQYDSYDQATLFIYVQDVKNEAWFGQCRTEMLRSNVSCHRLRLPTVNTPIVNFTVNRFHIYGGQYMHMMAYITSNDLNHVFVQDVEQGLHLFKLPLGEGFAGQASSIEFAQQYLVVVMKYAKEIRIYDMVRCVDFNDCRPLFNVTAKMMYDLNVKYFSPLVVQTSDFHPGVMFVQTMESVLILDITRKGVLVLDNIVSPATKELGYWGWKMAISQEHLVIVNAPDIIEEHNLLNLKSRGTFPTFLARNYPLYYYTIPETFDLDFSDAGGLIYITAIDTTTKKSVLLVYHAGRPTVASFYDVFNLDGAYEDIKVDATGNWADYVLYSTGTHYDMFRQYATPVLVFQDTFSDFYFNLTYTNSHNTDVKTLVNSTVRISNYPVDVKINNPKLRNQTYLDSLLEYKDDERGYVINDHGWFNGSVVNYTLHCEDECGKDGRIQLVNHVQETRDVLSWYGMWDYAFTFDGGVIQQVGTIITVRHNGTIQEYIDMPTASFGEICTSISVHWMGNGYVSACQSEEVLLYYTSRNSIKPFVMGPQQSSALGVAKLEFFNHLLLLTDVDREPWLRLREGGVILYGFNSEIDEPEFFDELEVFDSNDFLAADGWTQDKAYISNSHLAWTNSSDLYRLFITEVDHGLFLIDFNWVPGYDEVNTLHISFINLREMLLNESLPLPNQATFQAVTIIDETYDAKNQNWLIDLIVSVRNFHNIHLQVFVGPDHKVLHSEIKHVYYRYSFYESANYIKSFDGYFVTAQHVPTAYEGFDWLTRQLLVVYDTRPNRTETVEQETIGASNIPASHMLGAVVVNDLGPLAFDFNFTIRRNETDPFSNIGLVLVEPRGQYIREITLSESLHIKTKPGIKKTQHVKLIANNDYSKVELPITIKIDEVGPVPTPGHFPEWALALIMIGSIAVVAYIAYFIYKKCGGEQSSSSGSGSYVADTRIKKSLLESEAEMDDGTDHQATIHAPPTATQPAGYTAPPAVVAAEPEAVVNVAAEQQAPPAEPPAAEGQN